MRRPTRRLLVLAAAVALLATAACGSDAEPAGDGASAGGDALVVYSGRNENLIAPLLQTFTETTGIEVTARYGGSAELAAQLLEEGDRTPADVFLSQDAGALGALQDVDGFAALPQETLDKVPAQYQSATGAWVGVSGRSRSLVYNPELVDAADLPASVFDLADEQYRGQVGFAPTNASFQAFVTGMRVSAGEDRTRQFLEAFAANDPQPYDNNVAIVDAVNEGTLPYGLVNHYYLYERAEEAGGLENVTARNYLFPGDDPGSLVNVAGVGILAGSDDEQSRAFVEFLLSEQAQTYFAQETKEYPLIEGVENDIPDLPALTELQGPDVDLSELDSLAETLALLDEVGIT